MEQNSDKDPEEEGEEGTALTEGRMPGEGSVTGPRPDRFPTAGDLGEDVALDGEDDPDEVGSDLSCGRKMDQHNEKNCAPT